MKSGRTENSHINISIKTQLIKEREIYTHNMGMFGGVISDDGGSHGQHRWLDGGVDGKAERPESRGASRRLAGGVDGLDNGLLGTWLRAAAAPCCCAPRYWCSGIAHGHGMHRGVLACKGRSSARAAGCCWRAGSAGGGEREHGQEERLWCWPRRGGGARGFDEEGRSGQG